MKTDKRAMYTVALIGLLAILTGLYLVFAASELSFDQQVGIVLTLSGAAIIAVNMRKR